MPALKNQRQEIFCQEMAKGKSASESYDLAGYKPNRANASVLKSNQHIIDRVLELQGKRENRLTLSKQYVVDALLENAEKALGRRPVKISRRVKNDDGEYENQVDEVFVYEGNVANAAIRMAGQEVNMFVDRKDFRIVNEFDKLTDAELAQRLVDVGQQLLLAGPVIENEE